MAPKVLPRMGAVYFNSKVAPRLWKDESGPLELAEMLRRFPQWTYLPILPDRENTLRDCLREGVGQKPVGPLPSVMREPTSIGVSLRLPRRSTALAISSTGPHRWSKGTCST